MNTPTTIDLLSAISIALLFAIFVLGIWILITVRSRKTSGNEDLLRQDIFDRAQLRLETILREETKTNRDEASNRGKLLRDEVGNELRALNESQISNARHLRDEISQNLKNVGDTLNTAFTQISDIQKERLQNVGAQMQSLTDAFQNRSDGLRSAVEGKLTELKNDAAANSKSLREEVDQILARFGVALTEAILQISDGQKERLQLVTQQLEAMTTKNEQQQESLRAAVEGRLNAIREDNSAKLDLMRQTVDEKLQGTLEKRLGESFQIVSQQLENVYKSIGEMQKLATGVGDLKRVLTNVKARGTWGEAQAGNLLEQVLSPDQFIRNAEVKPGSGQRVEFAVRLPGKDNDDIGVLLPIDAKFPVEDYERLMMAAEAADKDLEEASIKAIEVRIKAAAKDISDKYICPPHSTDFALLFLPTEGLYAEVLRRPGLADILQRQFRVIVAGPTTLTAILNSLQMGFKSLAIQQRSSEVWQVLAAVKTEFGKYGDVLESVKKKLQQATTSLDQVSVRKRAIDRQLRDVQSLTDAQASSILGITGQSSETEQDDIDEAAQAPDEDTPDKT